MEQKIVNDEIKNDLKKCQSFVAELFKSDEKKMGYDFEISVPYDYDECPYNGYWEFISKVLNDDEVKKSLEGNKIGISLRCFPIITDKSYTYERLICGDAPMWKEHESRKSFERYYARSEMMRAIYCNEYDKEGNLYPIYLNIDNKRWIATWESSDDNDVFNYREATLEEIGTVNILWDVFGGYDGSADGKYKLIIPNVRFICPDTITLKEYRNIRGHITNLGFSIDNIEFRNLNNVFKW